MKFSSGSDGLLTIKLSDSNAPTLNFSLSNYNDEGVSDSVKTASFTDVLALYKGNGTGADSVAGAVISLKDLYNATIPEGGKFTNVTINASDNNKVTLS